MLTEIQDDNLSERVFEALRAAIMSKSLPPGSRVTEFHLAQQLNVSKTPVREALVRLRQIGLVEPDGRRGGRVVRPSREAIEHTYELREALETFVARAAATRSSAEQQQTIMNAAERSLAGGESSDLAEFRLWDGVFHSTLIEAAASPRVGDLLNDAYSLVVTLRARDVPEHKDSIECGRSHVAIAGAITRRHPDDAERLMRGHVYHVKGYVIESMDSLIADVE
jgi:DNA-binding GntR family transcriptional regulator